MSLSWPRAAPRWVASTVRWRRLTAADLGAHVIRHLLAKSGIKPEQVSEVILGQVLTGGAGQNPARQALIKAGLPEMCPAMTINKVCGSGLKATHLAAQAIRAGDAEIVIAGGQENMTLAPHLLQNSRDGYRMGDAKIVDSMILDGLWDVYNQYHMGVTAENVAKKYGVTREEQDAFAAASQQKAEAAQKAGRFKDEIIPLEIPQRKGPATVFDTDEYPKAGTTAEKLAGLKPAFDKAGTVTAGNASRHQRRRRSGDHDVGEEGAGAGAQTAGAHRGLLLGGRRSEDHGHGAGAGVQARACRRPAGRRTRPT